MPTITAPNQVTTRIVLTAGHRAVVCAIASRNGKALAYYPATWPGNFYVPSIRDVQRDARWLVA